MLYERPASCFLGFRPSSPRSCLLRDETSTTCIVPDNNSLLVGELLTHSGPTGLPACLPSALEESGI